MIKVSFEISDQGARSFVVNVGRLVIDRRELNEVLGQRLVGVIQDHWAAKNATPNRLGGERTHFWQRAANATVLGDVSESGATVIVGDEVGTQVGIHIHGGTIYPVVAEALTIPLVREAYNLRAALYEQKFNTELFTFGKQNVLFEKPQQGAKGSQSVYGNAMGKKQRSQVPFGPQTMPGSNRRIRGRSTVVPLVHRQELRAVYALVDHATIPADPSALPSPAAMAAALQEEADDYFAAIQGGALP